MPFAAFVGSRAVSGDLVLGVDCSTTACKAIAWDAEGRACAEGRAPIALHNPGPDAYEQDAEQWWAACGEAIGRAAAALGGAGEKRLRALCVTHQRETFVVTDEAGKPLHPALVWMDARCRDAVKRAVGRVGAERLHAISGKPACTTPSLYKLLFLLEEAAAELSKRRLRVLDVHGFLAWRLTGRFATSLASADPLGLVDMQARSWSDELLALAGLDRSCVPELLEPGAVIGVVSDAAARHCGITAGLPVVAGAGDGQAAGLGAGIVGPGRAYLNLGTAIVSGVLAAKYDVDPAFRTLYAATPGSYFLETDLKGGTFTLSWLAEKWLARRRRRQGSRRARVTRRIAATRRRRADAGSVLERGDEPATGTMTRPGSWSAGTARTSPRISTARFSRASRSSSGCTRAASSRRPGKPSASSWSWVEDRRARSGAGYSRTRWASAS